MIIRPNRTTSRLPSDYTEVEYIESSGTQYIDTGYIPTQYTKTICDFAITDTRTDTQIWPAIYEAQNLGTSADNRNYGVDYTPSNHTLTGGMGSLVSGSSITYTVGNKYHSELDSDGWYVDGQLRRLTAWVGSPSTSIALFSRHVANTGFNVSFHSKCKIYIFTMYDNNILVRNLIPCYRNSDNVAGLYDTVNNTFYTNSGTGVFTAGDIIKTYDVVRPKLGNTDIKNVYLGETRVYGFDPSQLVNYTMLYDAGDECIDITGGWTGKSFDLNYPAVGSLTKNTNNMYYSISGSNTSGPATVNLLDVSTYKYFSTLQKFKADSRSWENATVGIGRNNKTIISNTIIGTNINVTVPKLYKTDISNVAENGSPFASINYTGNITLYYAMLLKQDNWQQLCTVAGLTPSTYTNEDNLCSNSSAMSTILSNQSAVNYMIRKCTGSFMGAFIASSTALSALNSSPYKTTIQANEHWAKFLAMVA